MPTGEDAARVSYELHRLLGVPEDVDVDRLRRCYEEQMSAAARSHDHTRALALSSALDDLPAALRSAMYPRLSTRTALHDPPPARSPLGRPGRQRRAGAARPRRMRPARRQRSTGGALRVLLTLVGVIAIVLGIAYWQQHRLDSSGPPPFSGPGPFHRTPTVPGPDLSLPAARHDAHRVVNTIRHCLEQGGTLPGSVPPAAGRAEFTCGTRTFGIELLPGDTVSYLRMTGHTYRVVVTTASGASVSYDSTTDHFSA